MPVVDLPKLNQVFIQIFNKHKIPEKKNRGLKNK